MISHLSGQLQVLTIWDNVILMPHTAGLVNVENFAMAMADEIIRYKLKEALQYEIPYQQYKLMTR